MLRRNSISRQLYGALENPRHRHFLVLNYSLGFVTIVSVCVVVLETVPTLNDWAMWLRLTEYVAVGFFSLEYVMRLYYAKNRLRYVFSFYGLIDLLAIIPTYLGLTNVTFLKAARAIRVIRMLRTLRLIKVARFSDKKVGSQAVLGLNFEIYIVVLSIAIVMIGTLFYLTEAQGHAPTIIHGMYWVFQVIIGDRLYPTPDTTGGTLVMIMARFCALIFFGLTVGIIGAILRQKLTGSAKDVE